MFISAQDMVYDLGFVLLAITLRFALMSLAFMTTCASLVTSY